MSGPHSIKCGLCGSTNCYQENNVGWDICEDGEEEQHMQHCRDCGAKRFLFDFISFDGTLSGKPKQCCGQWYKGNLYDV